MSAVKRAGARVENQGLRITPGYFRTWWCARGRMSSNRHQDRALLKIPGEGIKGDQKDGKHNDPDIPHMICLFCFFQHVGNGGAKEKYLEARQKTRRHFHQRILVNKGNEEDGAASRNRNQAQ
jgi:hypothetical protein